MKTQHLKNISTQDFVASVIGGKANAVVSLSAEWNGASQLNEFALSHVATHYASFVQFFRVNTADEHQIREAYRIDAAPSLLFFSDGELVDKLSGLVQRSIIHEKIQTHYRNQ